MARPIKEGLDYFELDCLLDTKMRLIQAEFGLKGFAIVVKLLQKIYGEHGYYCEWNEEQLLLFASENGLNGGSVNLIQEIVLACVKRNIFSKELFDSLNILTSSGVQKRYLRAVSRREDVQMKKEYLLVSVGKNKVNVVSNSVNVCNNPPNVDSNAQRREDKTREENKKTIGDLASPTTNDVELFFESIWQLYPIKKGKGSVSKAQKTKLFKIGYDQLHRCIERYAKEQKSEDKKYWKYGSTFFNSGYVDYLDCNYETNNSEEKSPETDDRFSALEANVRANFEQRGIIKGQSIDLGNANEEQIKYLQKAGVL